MRIAVIGAGGWGTALATLLVATGHQVCLWVRQHARCTQLQHEKENRPYLPGVLLPETLQYSTSLAVAVKKAELVVFVVPSHALRETATSLASVLQGKPILVSATKGIEEETLQTMSTVM